MYFHIKGSELWPLGSSNSDSFYPNLIEQELLSRLQRSKCKFPYSFFFFFNQHIIPAFNPKQQQQQQQLRLNAIKCFQGDGGSFTSKEAEFPGCKAELVKMKTLISWLRVSASWTLFRPARQHSLSLSPPPVSSGRTRV